MRIAVTGGLGFIGNFLVKELLRRNHEVVIVDIREEKMPQGVEFQQVDVTDFDQVVQALNDVDVVYHLAGTVLGVARKNPHLAARLDVLGTANVLEASVRMDVGKVIYASSFYVYDGLPADIEVNEKWRSDIFKAEMFGVVKMFGERLVLEFNRQHGLKYVILRYGPVYGPSNRCSCVAYDFIMTGLRGDPLVIWGSGERKNQYTYVEDIADGCVAALLFENEIFNLMCPDQPTIRQVAEFLARKYGFKVETDLSKKEGPSMPYMSPRKAMEKLNWKPMSIEEGIEKTVEILKSSIY